MMMKVKSSAKPGIDGVSFCGPNKNHGEENTSHIFGKAYWGTDEERIKTIEQATKDLFINPLVIGVIYPEYDVA